MTGTTIETCIRIMSRWNKDDVVRTEKDGFVVLDSTELERIAARLTVDARHDRAQTVAAHRADALDGGKPGQLDVRRHVVLARGLVRAAGRWSGTSCWSRERRSPPRRRRPSGSASAIAPARFAPDEIPTPSPSSRASFCAIRMASPSWTAMISFSSARWTTAGMNSSEIPWMRCCPHLYPVDSVGDSAGSIGMHADPRVVAAQARARRP